MTNARPTKMIPVFFDITWLLDELYKATIDPDIFPSSVASDATRSPPAHDLRVAKGPALLRFQSKSPHPHAVGLTSLQTAQLARDCLGQGHVAGRMWLPTRRL